MSEIDDPIPREHTGCIVRAGLLIKRITKLQEAQELLDLGGVEQAVSTPHPKINPGHRAHMRSEPQPYLEKITLHRALHRRAMGVKSSSSSS